MLKKSYVLGLLAVGVIIPAAAFANNNSVVIKTVPVEGAVSTPDRGGCVHTSNRNVFGNQPVSRSISISKQSQSINGVNSSTEIYQSSVSTNSDGVVTNDVLCVLPQGVPGLP